MRKLLSLTTCIATLTCGMTYAQNAPVRNTLQAVGGAVDRATDVAATGVRGAAAATDRAAQAAVRGTAAAVNRTADAAANTVRGAAIAADRTTDAAGQVVGNTVQGTQQMLQGAGNALNPQMNYNAGYSEGYVQAQPMGQSWHQGTVGSHDAAVYTLHTDQLGREYICLGGQQVYVDNPNAMATSMQTADLAQDERYRAAYGSYDSENGSNEEASDQDTEAKDGIDMQAEGEEANRAEENNSDRGVDNGANSASATNNAEIESEGSDEASVSSDTAADTKNGNANIDSNADVEVNTQDASDLDLDTEIDAEAKLDASE